jgi:flagellar biosynthesis repressor protein FlbT
MSGRLKLHLRANERLFINGAVVRVDRKVSLELLNDVVFLLESHVMQQDEATTPLRQLYFVVQSMLIDPRPDNPCRELYAQMHRMMVETIENADLRDGLCDIDRLVTRDKLFDALKRIRPLFPLEGAREGRLMADETPLPTFAAARSML